jgi:hypothetical protein
VEAPGPDDGRTLTFCRRITLNVAGDAGPGSVSCLSPHSKTDRFRIGRPIGLLDELECLIGKYNRLAG